MGRRRLEVGEHGTIKVTRLDAKKFRARCEVRCRDGKIRSVQAEGQSKSAATDAVKKRATDRAETCGRILPGGATATITPVTTVAVLADKWWDKKQRSGITDQTITHYEPYHLLIKQGLGELLIREVTTATIEWFLDAEAADKPSKASNLRRQLTEMFAIAIRNDAYPAANPVREVTVTRAERKTVRALTVEELTAYREHIRQWQETPARTDGGRGGRPRAQGLLDYVNVQLATGARINEVLALRWCDVDLEAEQPTARIGATLVPGPKDGPSIVRQEHRKAKDSFTVILPRFAVDTLLRMKVNAAPNPHDAIFPSATGTWKSAANLRTQLRAAHGKAWGWVKPHTFRKTVATIVAHELGIDEAAAQLGNTPAVAAKHYVARSAVAPDLRGTLDKLAPTDMN